MKPILPLLLLMASPLLSQEPDSSSALFHMREAERNFARSSVMYGRNTAFAENFADESVIFTDKWISNGKQFWKERKPNPVVLKWEPEFMDIAENRELGVSTGPWETQEYRPNTLPLSTGYFLTVWSKSPDGLWQVILDAGCSTPQKGGDIHKFSFPPGADKAVNNPKKVDINLVCRELMTREEQILVLWKNNPVPSTYTSFLAPGIHMQKNGHLPSTNSDTIKVWIAQISKTLSWTPSGSGVASSGDMGFTYGVLETQEKQVGTKGHYVRIWKRLPDGKWYINLEMMNMD